MLPTKFWAEMSWRDFAAADMSKVIAVLPVAAIEQHGPHLPVGVDTFINEGYLKRAVERVPDDIPVLFLPVQAIGKSNEHIEFPGTLTFSMETVTRAWTEIGESVARAGCRKLIFMNSHGGNVAVLAAVVRELRVRCDMLAVHAGWHTLGYPEGLYSAARARAWHPRRRRRDVADARLPAGDGEDERGAAISSARRSESSRSSRSCASPSRSASAGWRTTCTSSARRARRISATAEKGERQRRLRRRRLHRTAARRAGLRPRPARSRPARSATAPG